MVVALLSILCISKLKVSYLPATTVTNQISVYFDVAGSDPEQTEALATESLENALSGITGIKKISSVSSYNSGRIVVSFESESDLDYKYFEIMAAVRQLREHLSPRVSFPTVIKGDELTKLRQTPFLVYAVTFRENAEKGNDLLVSVRRKLAAVPGIKQVELSGYASQQLTITYDEQKLMALQLQPSSLLSAISKNTSEYYHGLAVYPGHGKLFIRSLRPINSLDDIRNIPVVSPRSGLIRLKELAEISLADQPVTNIFRINGERSVNLAIYADDQKNQVKMAGQIKRIIQEFESMLAGRCSFHLTHDNAAYIAAELRDNIIRSFFVVAILVALLFVSYHNWRPFVILTGTLLINLGLLLWCCWAMAIHIHLYSLAGITIAFGIMIDHGIIIFDYFHQDKNIRSYTALLGATLTTIASLLLVFLLPDEEKQNLVDFATIICIALVSSLLTNLLFTTALYRLLYRTGHGQPSLGAAKQNKAGFERSHRLYFCMIERISGIRKTFLVIVTLSFGTPFFLLPEKIESAPLYNRTIGSALYQQGIRPYLDKYTGGALRLFKVNVFDGSGFRDAGKTRLIISAEMPAGKPLSEMDKLFTTLESILKPYNCIDKCITRISSPQQGVMEVLFRKGFDHSGYPAQIKLLLTNKVVFYGGVVWGIYGSGQGFSNSLENQLPFFRIKITGYEAGKLDQMVSDYGQLLSTNKRVGKVDLNDRYTYEDKPAQQYNFHLNESALSARGLNHEDINNALAWERGSSESPAIKVDNTFYSLYFHSMSASSLTGWDLLNSPLFVNASRAIRFRDIGAMTLDKIPGAVYKENRAYVRIVSFEYNGSADFGGRFLDRSIKEFKEKIPQGYLMQRIDDSGTKKNDNGLYGSIIMLLIVVNYIICAILFENLFRPLIIIFTILVSFIGIFLVFYLFGVSFDQGGYAAFIMLGGLVANAGIFIIYDYDVLLRRNNPGQADRNRMLIAAVANRSRTILLTSISAVCGLIPFLFEGSSQIFWFSFAVGTLGGVIFSFFSIFIFLPVMLWHKSGYRQVEGNL